MTTKIRPYKTQYKKAIIELLAKLQEHLSQIDPLKQFLPATKFDKEKYFSNQLVSVQKKNGKIFIAETEGKIIGVIIGWIKEPNPEQIEYSPKKIAYISDLFIEKSYRKLGTGEQLISELEKHFIKNKKP